MLSAESQSDLEDLRTETHEVVVSASILMEVFKSANENSDWNRVLDQKFCDKGTCLLEMVVNKPFRLLVLESARRKDFKELFDSCML